MAWFAQKTKVIKSSIFWQKPWTPFGKFQFFGHFYKFLFLVEKAYFFIENIRKRSCLARFAQKNIDDKKFDFWQKTMDLPLWKNSMFWTFFKLSFSGLKGLLFIENIKKLIFLKWFAKKTHMIKSSIFWQKTRTNPLRVLSANRLSMAWENGIQIPFPFFVFRFGMTLKNRFECCFSFFVFV